MLLRWPTVFTQQDFQLHDGLLAPLAVIGNRDEHVRDRTLCAVQEIAIISQKHIQTGEGGRLVPIFECLRLGKRDSEQRGLPKRIRFFTIAIVYPPSPLYSRSGHSSREKPGGGGL